MLCKGAHVTRTEVVITMFDYNTMVQTGGALPFIMYNQE